MGGLGPCVNWKYHVSHMFHEWNFLYYTDVPIMLWKIKNIFVQIIIQLSFTGALKKKQGSWFHNDSFMKIWYNFYYGIFHDYIYDVVEFDKIIGWKQSKNTPENCWEISI